LGSQPGNLNRTPIGNEVLQGPWPEVCRTWPSFESTLGRRQLRLVLAWAELHQEELLENWRLARAGETLQEIDPLQ
jgi:hypothetical protein